MRVGRRFVAVGIGFVCSAGACGSERAESDAPTVTSAASALDASNDRGSVFVTDGSAPRTNCGSSLDLEGCACAPGGAPRECFKGTPSQAGVGACHRGQQSCVTAPGSSTEFANGVWGPCTGSGAPTTCGAANAQCGMLSDGCGGLIDCGECKNGYTCGAQGPNTCGEGTCAPKTCAQVGASCGQVPDGCTGTLDCGSCSLPQTCGGGGQPGVCGCHPTSCAAEGALCGSISDGCGGTLDCGTCTLPQTCGGNGVANRCGGGLPPGDDGGSATCAPMQQLGPGGYPPCRECQATYCCPEVTATAQSADFLEWRNCFLQQSCTTWAGANCTPNPPPAGYNMCGEAFGLPGTQDEYHCCGGKHPAGAALENALINCLQAHCTGLCL